MIFWSWGKNDLIIKVRLISKFMMSQTIAIHILPNISRCKCNQAMKFGKLIKYNMRTIFVEKSYTKCAEKLFPDPYLKNQN